jgi:DNA polymerase-1
MQLMLVTEKMSAKGWRIDPDKLQTHRATALARIEQFRSMFLAHTGLPESALGTAGSGSTHKVRDWFWIDQKAPPLVFNKLTKKPQFSTECLIGYAQDFAHEVFGPAAAALYALRKNKKLVEFCETYARFAAHDGRIHFSYNAAGTQTGRWTSSTKMRVAEPDGSRTTYSCNAQQVPKKTPSFDFGNGKVKLVDSLRDVFIADPGCVLIQADYEALELRLIAYVYGAKKLIEWIANDVDTHMENARGIFRELRLPADAKKVSKPSTEAERTANAAREAAKPLAYGVSYQMHDPDGHGRYITLYKTLKKIFPSMTEQQANSYAERFFELHPEIKRGQSQVRDALAERGYVTLSLDGRRLYYPDTPRGRNQALNFPMQGTGGALVNRALLELDRRLDWNGQEIRAQVHDELVVQAPRESALEVKGWIEECMAMPAQIGETFAGIPATGDMGLDWGNCSANFTL